MASQLRKVAAWAGHDIETMPWAELTPGDIEGIKARLQQEASFETGRPVSGKTANGALTALRQTMRRAWRLGQIADSVWLRVQDIEGVKTHDTSAPLAGRYVSEGERKALVAVCANDKSDAGGRDAAMIALLYMAGPRRAEVAALDLADVTRDDDEGGELSGYRIEIRSGKGAKARTTWIDNGAALYMADWLAIRGDAPGPLFWSGRKGGRLNRGQGMSNQAVRDVVARRARQASIADLGCHDLRRTWISDLLDAGVDIARVAELAGHSSTDTTKRYDRRPERGRRKAIAKLHIPYYARALVA